MLYYISENICKQECIPLGCIPSAAVADEGREGICSGRVSAVGGGLLQGGVSSRRGLLQGGLLGGGGVCLGVSVLGDVCQKPAPVNRITNR